MVDAVLSYHADPISCGVTRFSQQLAKRLDVPWGQLASREHAYPLVSLKYSELPHDASAGAMWGPHDLFLHDYHDWMDKGITKPRRIFTASEEIAAKLRPNHPSVTSAWCPSLVEAQPREPITVLSFGMAHKLRTDLYATLKDKLDATGEEYIVYVSAALHDGTTFADAAASFDSLRRLFGRRFVFLGTLSDDAMVDRLRTCTYVAAFFEKGLRENNTSVHAAIDHGATVLTNWDAQTPHVLRLLTHELSAPLPHTVRRYILRDEYGWDRLCELIRHA